MTAVVPNSSGVYAAGLSLHSQKVEIPVIEIRDPASTDTKYPIGKRWVNTQDNKVFTLKSYSYSNLIVSANWVQLGVYSFVVGSGNVETYTSSGIIIVTDGACEPTSRVLVSRLEIQGTVGVNSIPSNGVTADTFSINSSSSTDLSSVMYLIINEG